MNPVSIKNVGTAPISICHFTGLPITSRPDWTDILLDKDTDYKATLSILGDSILTSHASGYATLSGLKKGLEIADEVVISVMGEDHPYVRIEEFSNLHGTTLEARRYYIDHVRGSEQLLGLIFCGVSSMFNLSIKLAKRLNIVKFEVQIVNDYSEAVKLALKMLSIDGICEDDPIIDPKDTLSANIYTRPDWSVQLNDFSARFEIIDGDILHAATSGFLEEEHVAQIFQTHEKVMNAVALPKGSYYFVGGVEEVAGSRKARKLYYDYIVQWYENHPFQKYIFYGANRFLRAAINLASPFAPFNVRTVKDLDNALELIAKEKAEDEKLPAMPKNRAGAVEFTTSAQTRIYVDELLYRLGSIDWEAGGPIESTQADTSHPFTPVFDAIALIKNDLDELLRERTQAEVALQKAYDEVEAKVQKRTTELSKLNEQFMHEITERRLMEKALLRANTETQTRLIEQTILREAGELISSTLELDVLLTHIAEQICRVLDGTSSYILSYDPEIIASTVLADYYSPEASSKERVSDLGTTYEIEEDTETIAAGISEQYHVDDPDLTEFERAHLQKFGGQTVLNIPLQIRGRTTAYVELWDTRTHREFTPDEIVICQDIARQAAIAIENARLYEEANREIVERKRAEGELQKARDELEIRVQERTAELARVNIRLRQEIAERVKAEEALQKAYDEVEAKVQKRTTELSKLNEQLLHEITERMQMEEALIRANTETQNRLIEQTALREAGEVISSTLELDVLLTHIAEQICQIVVGTSSYILSYDPETMASTVIAEYFSPEASSKERVSDLGATYETEEDTEFIASGSSEQYHVDDIDLTESEKTELEKYGGQTVLNIPLQLRGRTTAYVELWDSRTRREFTPDEIAICQDIAQQAAIAIENARLYEEAHREITERKRAENELQKARDELEIRVQERTSELLNVNEKLRQVHAQNEQLLTAISSISIGVDMDELVTHWNETAEVTFGFPFSETTGKPLAGLDIQWDWELIQQSIQACKSNQQIARADEVPFTKLDGRRGLLGITIHPIPSEDGEYLGFLLLGYDITDQKNMEQQLAQAQKLKAIGQLAAGISHEINSPTQFVGGNLRFLRNRIGDIFEVIEKYDRLRLDAKRGTVSQDAISALEKAVEKSKLDYLTKEFPLAIQQSLEGIDRISEIISAMKVFSHPGEKKKSKTDINLALESTIAVSRNEWKYVAEIETDFDPNLPFVECLPAELNQAFLNVIVNAAHAIGEVVSNGSEGKGAISVSTRQMGGGVEIRVADSGAGIAADIRDRIFDPFFTTKEVGKGTGQGLSIAHNVVVEKHGGSISFETEAGSGTTFIIYLPLRGANMDQPNGG